MPRPPRSNSNTRTHAIELRTPALAVCSPKARLIIELDGGQHLEQEKYDDERTKHLESQGYPVIRFWNNQEINDIDSVMKVIMFALEVKE